MRKLYFSRAGEIRKERVIMSEMTKACENGVSRTVTLAAEINAIKETVKQTATRAAIEIGRRLREAKSLVPYGSWGRWLAESVDYSERTAQNLMALAEEYGGKETQAIAELPLTKAVLLLGVPGEEREAFLKKHEVEDMSTRALREEIARLNAEREKQQLTIEELLAQSGRQAVEAETGDGQGATAMPSESDDADALREERLLREEAQKRARVAEQEKDEARQLALEKEKAVTEARQALEKAKQDSETLRKLLTKEREDTAKAREQLKAREAEAARLREDIERAGQPIIQQVPPQDMVEELAKLRATAASEGGVAKFRAAFEIFRKSLEQMEDALRGMEGETRAQYAGAAKKAIEIAAGKLGV